MKVKHSLAPGKWSEVLAVPLITLLTLGGLVSAAQPRPTDDLDLFF